MFKSEPDVSLSLRLGLLVWPNYWCPTSNRNSPFGKQLSCHYGRRPCHHWAGTQWQSRTRQERRHRTNTKNMQHTNTDSLWTEDNCVTFNMSDITDIDLSFCCCALFIFLIYLDLQQVQNTFWMESLYWDLTTGIPTFVRDCLAMESFYFSTYFGVYRLLLVTLKLANYEKCCYCLPSTKSISLAELLYFVVCISIFIHFNW